jgi:hypothetical protein
MNPPHRAGGFPVPEPSPTATARSANGFLVRLTACALVLTCLAVATGFWWSNRRSQVPIPQSEVPKATTPGGGGKVDGQPAFADWPKEAPDLVLVLSGQTYGYLQPCGCSRPQQGGLERRYNFIQQLKGKGWNVVALDIGDVMPKPPENGEMPVPADQTFKKYEYLMRAYKEMGYAAVGLGAYDYKLDPFQLLPRYALNNPNKPPFILSGNVAGAERNGAGVVTKTTPREKYFGTVDGKPTGRDAIGLGVVVDGKVPFGVIGLAAPSVADAVTKNDREGPFHFQKYGDHLTAALVAFAQNPAKPELNVLLLQGNTTEAQQAAADFPGVQLIACLTDSSEPPGVPLENANTKQLVIQVGHKGRYVGVVGVFKTPKGFSFRYQLVPLGEEFLTPAGPAAEKANPVLQLLEEYAKDVKDADLVKQFVAKRPLHPAQINHPKEGLKYVGSEACAKCHAQEYAVWSGHKHSHAYEALEKLAKRPGLQNFNGECLVCHTTGFRYESGFESQAKTPALLNNGCENCHGPGSGHSANPKDPDLNKAMMPWRLAPDDKLPSKAVLEKYGNLTEAERARDATMPAEVKQLVNVRIAGLCMKCHDGDNDPKFDPWTYLPKIYHSGLKQAGLPGGIGK